jgi:hypothetical protein
MSDLGDVELDSPAYKDSAVAALEARGWERINNPRARADLLERERDAYDIFVREVHQAISDVICAAAPIMPDSPFAPLLALNDKLYDLAVNKKWPTTFPLK